MFDFRALNNIISVIFYEISGDNAKVGRFMIHAYGQFCRIFEQKFLLKNFIQGFLLFTPNFFC